MIPRAGEGWHPSRWVEAVRRYTSTAGVAADLARATYHLCHRAPATRPPPTRAATSHRQRLVAQLLTAEQIDALVTRFAAGTPKTVLAAEYNIKLRSVKRISGKVVTIYQIRHAVTIGQYVSTLNLAS